MSFNLLLTYQVHKGAPWLLFESHADTVDVENMTVNPFKTQVIEGKIYGRGTSDTKGSGASILWALKNYCQESHKPNNIAILFVTDEEISKTGANTFIEKQLSKLPWKPYGVILQIQQMAKVPYLQWPS
ncbi:MAG: M20/M25/M40 family metallo-hydrolase [Actinobacteria bacterium]|nr:M20/M25/M40 family metallo-hydrolase [Actinomycetota bacterium]